MRENWQTVNLEKLVTRLTNGYVGATKNIYQETGIPYLLAKHVRDNKLQFDGKTFVTDEFNQKNKKSLLEVDDVLLVQSGHIGHSAVVTEKHEWHNCHAMIVITTIKDKITGDYLSMFFQSTEMKNLFQKIRSGSTVPHLTCKAVKKIQIPLPPLPEQERIVSILDKAFEGIDKAIAQTEQNLASARELFESYLNNIFTQKGEDWVEKKLGEVGNIQTGSTPKTSIKANYGSHIPFVKPAHFNTDGTIDYEPEGLSEKGLKVSRLVEEFSVLMVCIGATIGKAGYVTREVTTNQQINSVTPSSELSYIFLYYQMLTSDFQRRVISSSGQATLPIINKTKWSNLSVIFPVRKAQEQLVSNLNKLLIKTQQLEALYTQKLNDLKELKQSLLQQAFAGELTKEDAA